VRGRGRPRKGKSEDNSHSADVNAFASVKLGKRSRHRATFEEDLRNYDLSDDASLNLEANHIDSARPSMALAMEEISMSSEVRFK
jgi:hypothetical protein